MSAAMETQNLILGTAAELHPGEICFVGIGVPSLAAMLAKRGHARDMTLIYESGAVDANPPVPPLSTGSPSVVADTAMIGDCLDIFADLQAGRIDVGLLSGAQVDRYGNLNSTVIGDYRSPKLRMVGSGGAHDIACLANRVVIVMPHEPRRFVERVDFVTSPGCLEGGMRAAMGLGGGPAALVTGRGRFVFADGEMSLAAAFDPFSLQDAVEGLSWDVPVRSDATVVRFGEEARERARQMDMGAAA